MEFKVNKDVSKGGILGAAIGAAASTKVYSPQDKTIHKVAKTGLFAGVGYLLGAFIEKWFLKKNKY